MQISLKESCSRDKCKMKQMINSAAICMNMMTLNLCEKLAKKQNGKL